MTPFTDEDVKRLKSRLNDPIDDEIDKSLQALIARLERAELFITKYFNDDPMWKFNDELRAWRKAARK